MPAVYAHDRFGIKVQEQMKESLHTIAERYHSAYQDGLQGPDIFFFYRPWFKNRVQRYGEWLHENSAAPFFRHALSIVRKYGRNSSQYAYLLGFICHFTLDSECHPYIDAQIERSGVAHLEIEAEFEKYLLHEDGFDPVGYDPSVLIYSDAGTAEAIAPFFPSINRKTAGEALYVMQLVKKLFRTSCPVKQEALNTVMRLAGVYHEMNGLIYQRKDNPLCVESSRELQTRFEQAIPLAAALQEQFDECLRTGKSLPDRFHRTFE
ncbi:MAG: zinc dependent phospholipase C family protein [Lachnospiraceae bacterium]|nr:zinc dependent phospholipase C family protein [Lachnospiraceae bacterium]